MPASVSSMPSAMLLASTSSGVRAALAHAIAQIMSVKPGPSVPEVDGDLAGDADERVGGMAIEPSWRPPKAGIPVEAIAWITG